MGIGIEDFRDRQEFHDVQTSIAVFILGDERLGLAYPVGQGLLGHVSRLPRRYQAPDQGLVLLGLILVPDISPIGMFGCKLPRALVPIFVKGTRDWGTSSMSRAATCMGEQR